MSLILDALNKAQREREEKREAVPQLTTVHATPAAPPRRPRKWLIPAGIAVVLLVIASFVGGLWLNAGRGDPAPVAVTPTSAPTSAPANAPATGPVQREPVEPATDSASPATAPAPTPPEVAQAPRQEEAAEPVPSADAASAEGQAETEAPESQVPGVPVPDEDVASLYEASRAVAELEKESAATQPRAQQGQQEPPAQEAAPQSPQKPAVSQDSLAAREDIPYVQDLSWATQQELPSIVYGGHQYGSVPSSRVVELNGSSYRTGAQVAPGMVLEEILRDGIVMRYQGQRFKLDALNSWVNF